jgi:hypothetical protein
VISQLFVLIEELAFVRTEMGQASLVGAAIEMTLFSAVPYGRSCTAVGNILRLAVYIANKFVDLRAKFAFLFFLLVVQIIMFVVFRACLGGFYLYTLRYKRDVGTFFAGGYVYLIDVFGPFYCFFRLLFKLENFNERRLFYAVVGMTMSYLEYQYASDAFLVRLIFTLADILVYRSHYGKAMHYLEFDVDFMSSLFLMLVPLHG